MNGRLTKLVRAGFGGRMVVLLHGLGSNEADLFAFSESLDYDFTVVSLRAPREYEYGGFKWFSLTLEDGQIRYDAEEARESLRLLTTEIAALCAEFNVAPNGFMVAGFSQGAIMGAALALSEPQMMAGAWLMSGALMPELVPSSVSADVSGLKTLVQHGAHDPVLPVSLGRDLAERLGVLGLSVEYREYPMGHQVSLESLQDGVEFVVRGTSEATRL